VSVTKTAGLTGVLAVTDHAREPATILETHGLTKDFKGFTAVKDINLSVRTGSIHALIGPNGAGKTTFSTC